MKGKSDYEAKGVLGAYMSPYARYLPSRNRRRGKEGEKNLIGVQYMCATFTIFANTGREVGIRNLCPSPLSANRKRGHKPYI